MHDHDRLARDAVGRVEPAQVHLWLRFEVQGVLHVLSDMFLVAVMAHRAAFRSSTQGLAQVRADPARVNPGEGMHVCVCVFCTHMHVSSVGCITFI